MRSFILTPTYRLVDGRPEVHLYGVLESGEPEDQASCAGDLAGPVRTDTPDACTSQRQRGLPTPWHTRAAPASREHPPQGTDEPIGGCMPARPSEFRGSE